MYWYLESASLPPQQHSNVCRSGRKMWKNVLFYSDILIQMDLTSLYLSQHKSEFFPSFQVFWIKKFHHFHPFNADKKCAKSSDDGNFFSLQNCMNNRQNFWHCVMDYELKEEIMKSHDFSFLLLLFPSSIKLIRFSSLSLLSSLYGSPKQFFIIFFLTPTKKSTRTIKLFFFCAYINIIVNISGEARHK